MCACTHGQGGHGRPAFLGPRYFASMLNAAPEASDGVASGFPVKFSGGELPKFQVHQHWDA
ncbi:MAG: hypothetical protein CM1200mP27_09260 [Chloroflexota bacterium]|nr:MAG: hypothetical protein CM1200mP27_09260 [Chloroflexota bacterium]